MRRRAGTIFLLAGSAALVWCLTVLAGAALYQHYETWRLSRIAQPGSARSMPVPKLHQVLGELEIPSLQLSTAIFEGDDDGALRFGAGHVPGTAFPYEPGNVAIAAHRDTFFRPLRKIKAGDRITIATADGSYSYAVTSTEIVRPTATRVLKASSGPELTLITCYPFYYIGPAPLRFIVHATRLADPSIAHRG